MGNRKLITSILSSVCGAVLLLGSGVASAKNLLPSSAAPTSISPMTAQPTVPAPRAQRPSTQAQSANVPGFDYGPRKPVHNSTIAGAESTIPGAPRY